MSEHPSLLHAGNHGPHVTSVYCFSLPVGRWKSISALLEREVPERFDGSTPPELEVMK